MHARTDPTLTVPRQRTGRASTLWTLHARYVSTVSGPGADTDRIHCIWAEIQLVQYVLYLIVSEVEADTDCIHRIIQ